MSHLMSLPSPFNRLPKCGQARRQLEADEYLFRQGDQTRAMYFLEQGTINLIRHTKDGQKVTMFQANAGDTLAEPALFSDHFHCDATAQSSCLVLCLDKTEVLEFMTKDPSFAAALVQRMASQIQTYRRRLELLAIRPARDRVLAGLADGWLTGSIIEFASELGLTHEAVYRALSTLVREGQVARTARGSYRVKGADQAAL